MIDFFGRINRLQLSADFLQQSTFLYIVVFVSHSDHATRSLGKIHGNGLTCSTELETSGRYRVARFTSGLRGKLKSLIDAATITSRRGCYFFLPNHKSGMIEMT